MGSSGRHRKNSMRRSLLLSLILFLSPPLFAHVFPERAHPKVGETLYNPPADVSILFDGEIEPVFSTLRVENKNKVIFDKNDSSLDPLNSRQLRVTLLSPLPLGVYYVSWTAIARDGHQTTGRYQFRLKAPPRHD